MCANRTEVFLQALSATTSSRNGDQSSIRSHMSLICRHREGEFGFVVILENLFLPPINTVHDHQFLQSLLSSLFPLGCISCPLSLASKSGRALVGLQLCHTLSISKWWIELLSIRHSKLGKPVHILSLILTSPQLYPWSVRYVSWTSWCCLLPSILLTNRWGHLWTAALALRSDYTQVDCI